MDTYLSRLSKEEIIAICKNVNYDLLLQPIKKERKRYSEYAKRLGNMEKNSSVVKTFLPKTVVDLCVKAKDKVYISIMEEALATFKEEFITALSERLSESVQIEELHNYDDRKLAKIFIEMYRISKIDFSVDFFLAMLKICDLDIGEAQNLRNEISEKLDAEKYMMKLIEEAKASLEKQLSDEQERYAREKREWEREKKEILQSIKKANEEKENLQKILDSQKTALIEKWKQEFEIWKQKEIELERRKREEEALQFESELKLKSQACEQEIEIKHKQFLSMQEEEKKKFSADREEAIAEYQKKIADFTGQLEVIEQRVTDLKAQEEALVGTIGKLQSTEEDFFRHFDERIIERRIESTILSKFQKEDDHGPIATEVIGTSLYSGVSIQPEDFHNAEQATTAQDIEDFLMDFKDNLSIWFNETSDIARCIVATLICQKAIIVEDGCAEYITCSLSALVGGQSAYIIDLSQATNDLAKTISIINEIGQSVILIRGVLDAFDELTFMAICKSCSKKKLFFEIGDIRKVQLMSNVISKHAIIINASKYLHIKTNDAILIGNHDFDGLFKPVERKNLESYYNSLNTNDAVKKYYDMVSIMTFSELLANYTVLNANNTYLGDVVFDAFTIGIKDEDQATEIKDYLSSIS